MSLRSALGSALGYTLLGLACLFMVFARYLATVSALTSATTGRAMLVVFGLGAAVTTGFSATHGGR